MQKHVQYVYYKQIVRLTRSFVTRALLSSTTYPIFSSSPRYLYESPSFNGLIVTVHYNRFMAFYIFSFVNGQDLDFSNIIPMSLENCVTKSSSCLIRFRLTAMSFNSSTKINGLWWYHVCETGQFCILLISLIKTTMDLLKE